MSDECQMNLKHPKLLWTLHALQSWSLDQQEPFNQNSRNSAELPASVNPEQVARIFKILPAQSFQAITPSPTTEPYPGKEIFLLPYYPWTEL